MNETKSDDVTEQYCTNCETFLESDAMNEVSCPECEVYSSVAYVVIRRSDEKSIMNTLVPASSDKITLEAARGDC